jgi:antitoxin PrlF
MSGTPASNQPRPRPVSARARLRPKSQLTLPEEVRRALRVNEGDEVEFTVREDGTITVRGYISVPTDHAWLYVSHQNTPRTWDSGLTGRQAMVHESADAMLSHLDGLGAADA